MVNNKQVVAEPPKAQAEVLDGFLGFLSATNRKEKTIKRHAYCLKKFLEFAGPDFDFDKATRQDIIKIIGRMNSSTTAPETKRKAGISVKCLYKWYKGEGDSYPKEVSWIKTSGTSKMRLPEELLSEQEVNRMINAAINIRDRAIISVLFESGCRCGELLNLRIKDCEINSEGGHLLLSGKTGMRKIPIKKSLPYLTAYLDAIDRSDPDKPMWLQVGSWTSREEPINNSAVAKVLKRCAKRAGIRKRVFPHLFRHSSATYWANKLTEQQLKYYFGWVGASKMAATYVHLSGRDIDNAVLSTYSDTTPAQKIEAKPPSNKVCRRCGASCGLASLHCYRCGDSLDVSIELTKNEDVSIIREFLRRAAKDPKLIDDVLGGK